MTERTQRKAKAQTKWGPKWAAVDLSRGPVSSPPLVKGKYYMFKRHLKVSLSFTEYNVYVLCGYSDFIYKVWNVLLLVSVKHDPKDQFQWALSQMETIKSFAFNCLHLGKIPLTNNQGGHWKTPTSNWFKLSQSKHFFFFFNSQLRLFRISVVLAKVPSSSEQNSVISHVTKWTSVRNTELTQTENAFTAAGRLPSQGRRDGLVNENICCNQPIINNNFIFFPEIRKVFVSPFWLFRGSEPPQSGQEINTCSFDPPETTWFLLSSKRGPSRSNKPSPLQILALEIILHSNR